MDTKQSPTSASPSDERDLGRWTRRYAQSKSLPVLISLTVSTALFLALMALWVGLGFAYRSGARVAFWACVAGLIPAHIALVWLAMPRWGGRWLQRTADRYYGKEGEVTVRSERPPERMRRLDVLAAILYGAAILLTVVLGFLGYVRVEYLQPVSALYVVPFLVFLFWLMRPQVGYLALLWPGLYGLHAILVVAGAPIQFEGHLVFLSILGPIVGYGVIGALAGHLYNRIALARVKGIGHVVDPGGDARRGEGQ